MSNNVLDILRSGDGWVSYTYPDSSKKVFRTTLNEKFLGSLGVELRGDAFYDLDRQEFVVLTRGVKIDITRDKPSFERTVDAFANQFI